MYSYWWKIGWQKYTFRLSRTKLKSNWVSRQWAICTSDRSGVLWLESLGLDTVKEKEWSSFVLRRLPSCLESRGRSLPIMACGNKYFLPTMLCEPIRKAPFAGRIFVDGNSSSDTVNLMLRYAHISPSLQICHGLRSHCHRSWPRWDFS